MSAEAAGAEGVVTAGRQRLDRWLWAARFFKTRSLSRRALGAGKVELNGARAKPAKTVTPGDTLTIRCPAGTFTVVVQALNEQRRPAREAVALYDETPASRAARARESDERRARRAAVVFDRERPDRRARRAYIRFRRDQRDPDD